MDTRTVLQKARDYKAWETDEDGNEIVRDVPPDEVACRIRTLVAGDD